MFNFLDEFPKARKWTYFFQWTVNLALAVLGAYFATVKDSIEALPDWYVVALAVAPILWTYLGLQAGANTPASSPPPPDNVDERGSVSVLEALLVALVVILILVLAVPGIFR